MWSSEEAKKKRGFGNRQHFLWIFTTDALNQSDLMKPINSLLLSG